MGMRQSRGTVSLRVAASQSFAFRCGDKMLCGGEALPRDLADRLLPMGRELWNMYGPTETTIWSLVERVLPGEMHPGIGRPIANTQVYILDAAGRPTHAPAVWL